MFSFLKKNKDAVKKYMLIVFLGIVSLSMVVVMAPLPSGDTSTPRGNVLASVEGDTITSADLDQTIRDRFKNSPMGYDSRMVPMVAPSVLDQMVIEQILLQQAKKLGLEVSDGELLKAFQSIPWLYPDGNFIGADRAADMVAQNTGKTLGQFESMLRDSLMEEKIRSVVTDDVQVSPAEVLAESATVTPSPRSIMCCLIPAVHQGSQGDAGGLGSVLQKRPCPLQASRTTPGALCRDRS